MDIGNPINKISSIYLSKILVQIFDKKIEEKVTKDIVESVYCNVCCWVDDPIMVQIVIITYID